MNDLSTRKLAWFSVTRRTARSVYLILLMIVIFTALIAQFGVRAAMQNLQNAINTNVNAGFVATAKNGEIDIAEAAKIAALNGVKSSSYELQTLAKPNNAKPVANTGGIRLDPEFGGDVGITGTTDSQLYPAFQGQKYRLMQGTHLKPKSSGAIVHQDFAQQNGLKIGSTLELNSAQKKVSLKVVGIFQGKSENPSGLPAEAAENQVFADLESAQTLSDKQQHITAARFFTNSAKELPSVFEKAKALNKNLIFESNETQFADVLKAMAGVEHLLSFLLIGVCGAGLVTLSLVLIFWIRGRIYEIGVFLALGKTKIQIFGQLLLEISYLGIAAAAIAFPVGKILATWLGTKILNFSTVNLSAVNFSAAEIFSLITAFGIGYVIFLLSLAIATTPIFIQKPRAILAKMS